MQEEDSAEEWLDETAKERRARHERYGAIAAEKAPKSTSLQEQAKALAEPLELVEEAFLTFAKNRPQRDGEEIRRGASNRVWDGGPVRNDMYDEDDMEEEEEETEEDKNRREKRRQKREQKRRERDMDDYDEAIEKLNKARHIMERKMAVIDMAHRYNWDVAQRFHDKRQPVKDRDLKAALEEAKKDAEAKKEKTEKERRSRIRTRYRETFSPRRRSRSPRRRSRSPRSFSRQRSGYDRSRSGSSWTSRDNKDRQGCFECGDRGHRIRDCPNRKK